MNADLINDLKDLKNSKKTLKKTKKLVNSLLNEKIDEINKIKIMIKFNEISVVLNKDGYKLISLTKDENGLFVIEYQIINDTTNTYKMLYQNYKIGCRAENIKIKYFEEDYYERFKLLFGDNNVKRNVKLDGLKNTRPLFIDFEIKIDNDNNKVVYIEIDENNRHFKRDDIQFKRDKLKDNFIIEKKMKMIRIDPLNYDNLFTNDYLNKTIREFISDNDKNNILLIGKRYNN